MKIGLSKALPAVIICYLFAAIMVFFAISYVTVNRSYDMDAKNRLNAVLQANLTSVQAFFETVRKETQYQAGTTVFVKALVDLSSGWDASDSQNVRNIFLTDEADRSLKLMGDGNEMYEFMHEAHHGVILNYLKQSPFSDVFIVNEEGRVFYSAMKGDEFGLVLNDLEADVGHAFKIRDVLNETPHEGSFQSRFLSDSVDGSASYIASRIIIDGASKGYLVTKLAAGELAKKFNSYSMTGKTGAISFIDARGDLVASTVDATSGKLVVLKEQQAVNQNISTDVALSGNGRQSKYIVGEIAALPVQYRLVVQQDQDEIFEISNTLAKQMGLAALVILVISGTALYVGFGVVLRPLSRASTAIMDVANGASVKAEAIASRFTEISQIAESLAVFTNNIDEKTRLEEQTKSEHQQQLEKSRKLEREVSLFKSSISKILGQLTTEAEGMKHSADMLESVAIAASEQVSGAKKSADSASENVHIVARSTEELTYTIDEIAEQTNETNAAIENATGMVGKTREGIEELSDSTDRIGEIIGFIRGIAEQTNLLALNATIEAARAGDAGKGFAVVANEVKQLSDKTAQATDQIADQISRVQSSTQETVSAIKEVSTAIAAVTGLSTTIASAVEEQGASTKEIARRLEDTAQDSATASKQVDTMSDATVKTTREAEKVLVVSNKIKTVSDELSLTIDGFLQNVS